ncbi:MAG: WcaI family glycosyltransferase [Burkholderiaceae bacterium]
MARLLHLFSFALTSLPVMLIQALWRPDVVITVAPALMCAPAGWLTARLSGGRAWLHMQDFEVDVAFQMGLLNGRLLKRFVLRAECWLLRRFDCVSSISGRMLELLRKKYVVPERIMYFPNWVDIDHVRLLTTPSTYRQELGISSDAIVVLFSGTMGSKQGLMVIPDAARRLVARKDVVFVICGDGVMRPQLEAATADLSNIRMLPLQPFERLAELLGMADIHLLPQSPEAEDLVLPSKLSGMVASGRPVIATCRANSEIAEVVSKCGIVVAPEDGSALAIAIEELADDTDRRLMLGALARRYAEENLALEAVLSRLVNQMRGLGTTAEPALH